MNTALRLLVIAAGLALLAAGLAFAFVPDRIAADFAVVAEGIAGRGTLRADLGGLFVAMGGFALAGVRKGREHWLAVTLALVAIVLVLRLLHVAIDGPSEAALRLCVAEAALGALFATARRRLGRTA
jgi:hypothetical protein